MRPDGPPRRRDRPLRADRRLVLRRRLLPEGDRDLQKNQQDRPDPARRVRAAGGVVHEAGAHAGRPQPLPHARRAMVEEERPEERDRRLLEHGGARPHRPEDPGSSRRPAARRGSDGSGGRALRRNRDDAPATRRPRRSHDLLPQGARSRPGRLGRADAGDPLPSRLERRRLGDLGALRCSAHGRDPDPARRSEPRRGRPGRGRRSRRRSPRSRTRQRGRPAPARTDPTGRGRG